MPDHVITANELLSITTDALAAPDISIEDLVDDWLFWFEKRGERFLTTAAKFGYTSVALDLPLQLATKLERGALKRLIKKLALLVPGCDVSLLEEEYEGNTLYKVEVSWKPRPAPNSN
jgi:hypothetical protein